MKKISLYIFATVVIVACLAAGVYLFQKSQPPQAPVAQPQGQQVPANSFTDIYPLPSGITWNEAQTATLAAGDVNVASTLIGIKVESQPIQNITDLSAPSMPFDAYYQKKLTAAGWTVDNDLAAGGPGAEITGYTKGNEYIILEYSAVFKNQPADSPETCPCDLTFSVFEGTAK